MSEWKPEVVRVGPVFPHPNHDSPDPSKRCDTLSMTDVHGGYPVLFRTGEFKEGDLAVYVPIDTRVPVRNPAFAFLANSADSEDRSRIKAKRLRGVFSMGMLVAAPEGMAEGDSAVDAYDLVKWEPKEERARGSRGACIPGPSGWDFVKYTDLEGLRRFKGIIQLGEEVVITEKIHGQNGRYCWDPDEGKLWVGSRTTIKQYNSEVNWWRVADKLGLQEKLSRFPHVVFFGEVYGKSIQDLAYGQNSIEFRVFDTYDVKQGRYNDWDVTVQMANEAGLPLVPVLYRGPWLGFDEHKPLSEGESTIASHVREGYVVKPVCERYERRCGRVIFKMVGEGYLLRKEK